MPKPGIILTVGGVPWENLTDEHRGKIIKRNTEVVAEIVSRQVIRMAEEGSTIEEIGRFLKLDGYYERKEEGRDETN
ncbi:hypothetical protein NE686_00355 [Tissierella carlieri]|uniref:Uncharacterized protein n=2 Tax=Tissierella carlieri TaxID=689904 RepID=A0ABT1S4X8_9FIRM|nr:hypothetical protein [Tissierella carlieri]